MLSQWLPSTGNTSTFPPSHEEVRVAEKNRKKAKARSDPISKEFNAVFLLAVYIPPRPTGPPRKDYCTTSTRDRSPVFVVAGDLNHCNHVYRNVRGAYKAVPRLLFRQSDHSIQAAPGTSPPQYLIIDLKMDVSTAVITLTVFGL